MSLKVFHIAFITLSVALALGCGVWTIRGYAGGRVQYLWGLQFPSWLRFSFSCTRSG